MTVKTPHARSFETAPVVEAGDRVAFIRFDPKNSAWFFGRDRHGIEGYFPAQWFAIDEGTNSASATRPYDASELTVAIGDRVEPVEKYGAWLLARSSHGTGWIPLDCVH